MSRHPEYIPDDRGERVVRLLQWRDPVMGVEPGKVLQPGRWFRPEWAPKEFFNTEEEASAVFAQLKQELINNKDAEGFPYPAGDYRLELCYDNDGEAGDDIEHFEQEVL